MAARNAPIFTHFHVILRSASDEESVRGRLQTEGMRDSSAFSLRENTPPTMPVPVLVEGMRGSFAFSLRENTLPTMPVPVLVEGMRDSFAFSALPKTRLPRCLCQYRWVWMRDSSAFSLRENQNLLALAALVSMAGDEGFVCIFASRK